MCKFSLHRAFLYQAHPNALVRLLSCTRVGAACPRHFQRTNVMGAASPPLTALLVVHLHLQPGSAPSPGRLLSRLKNRTVPGHRQSSLNPISGLWSCSMSQVLSCPFLVAVTLVLPSPESQGLPRWPGPATSLQGKARQLGRGSQAVRLGTGLNRGKGGGAGEASCDSPNPN